MWARVARFKRKGKEEERTYVGESGRGGKGGVGGKKNGEMVKKVGGAVEVKRKAMV